MKHLKLYNESKEEDLDETRSDIRAMCYDITDDGEFGIAFGKKRVVRDNVWSHKTIY